MLFLNALLCPHSHQAQDYNRYAQILAHCISSKIYTGGVGLVRVRVMYMPLSDYIFNRNEGRNFFACSMFLAIPWDFSALPSFYKTYCAVVYMQWSARKLKFKNGMTFSRRRLHSRSVNRSDPFWFSGGSGICHVSRINPKSATKTNPLLEAFTPEKSNFSVSTGHSISR